jgi:probable F420-dependent oxidoreductase
VKVGVWIPCYKRWVGRETVRELATEAEALGFGSLWVQDHLVAPIGSADEQPVDLLPGWLEPDDYGNRRYSAVEYYGEENWWLDPYILWGFLAALTERCELGSGVVVVPYRHPIVQAKMLGTLDVLSGGRMLFGAGVGHVPGEFECVGADYARRGEVTDEYLRAMTSILAGEEASFHGPTTSFGPVRTLIQTPLGHRPPFLIGGTSKRSVRRAIELGDEWLPAHVGPERLTVGLAYLEEQATAAGVARPPVSVVASWGMSDPSSPAPSASRRQFRSVAETAELIGAYAELGVVRLAIDVPNPNLRVTLQQFALLAEAARQVGALVGA